MGDAMILPRRKFLLLAAGAGTLPAWSRVARGQTYPVRPVRLIVGFPAGGVTDVFARLIGQWMQERLGQPFVVENRPGGGSNIAAEVAVRAAPDGYTLFLLTSANAISASVYRDLKFNLVRDFSHVAGLARGTLVMLVNPSVPATTVAEFVAYAKANAVNMASNGIGTTSHLAGELFKMMSGVDMGHVPYRGAALSLPDLIAGRVHVMFDVVTSSIAYIQAGQVRSKSSKNSMWNSTRGWPMRKLRHGWPIWEPVLWSLHRRTSPSLLPTKPRNGRRW
jgi:tripartite-type tricarboxylate transporter receptor subunit TctC